MIARVRSQALLPAANIAILAIAYFTLFIPRHVSTSYRGALVAGGAFLCLATALTFAGRARLRWLTPPPPRLCRAIALVPWLAVIVLIAAKGLWWTQRPAALRFYTVYALANWSTAWCLAAGVADVWEPGARRAVTVLATVLAVLGLQGAAFGVTPYGCGVSAVLALTAALALAIARSGTRAACLKIFAASAATLATVAALEGTIRLLRIGHNVQETDSREYAREFYSLTPPRSAFVNRPNTLDEFGPALVSINSLGIRGPEPTDSSTDVLLIGDSMIEARQLPWDQTLGPQLQQALRTRGSRLRVVAHGMRGWSPLLEWNWYLKVGRGLHPRIVMLFFFWNDLWTAGAEASTFSAELRPDGRPDHFNVPVDAYWIWYKHVRVIRLAADVWHRLSVAEVRGAFASMAARKGSSGGLDEARARQLARSMTEPPLSPAELDAILTRPEGELTPELRPLSESSLWPGLRPLTLWSEPQRSAGAKTELELRRFSEDVAADGGRLVIVYVPNPLQLGPGECTVGRLFERVDTNTTLPPDSGIETWLRGVAQRQGIELLNPSDAMRDFERTRQSDGSGPLYLRADCHWSERGHQFMAAFLADWCERNGPHAR